MQGTIRLGFWGFLITIIVLGSPVVPFYPFSFWVPLLKPNRSLGFRTFGSGFRELQLYLEVHE